MDYSQPLSSSREYIRKPLTVSRVAPNSTYPQLAARSIPVYAWLVLAIGGTTTGLCIANLGYGAGVLRILFPLATVIVGFVLYFRSLTGYLEFTFFVWFVSPFVRRLIDLYAGWLDPSPVLLAPIFVTLISGLSFVSIFRVDSRFRYPFLLALVGILFGLGVGLLRSGPIAVIVPLLNFLVPVLLGVHIISNWQHCHALARTFDRTIAVGVFIMGTYGIVQYILAPAWDTKWLLNVDPAAAPTFGVAEPFGIRVFSTLNSPLPFGICMMVGLLVLANRRGWSANLILLIGYFALSLSLARTAWLGWATGAVFLAFSKKRSRWKLVSSVALFLLVSVAATSVSSLDTMTNVISKRAETFAAPTEDFSFNVRVAAYAKDIYPLLFDPFGQGIASQGTAEEADAGFGPHDSAALELVRCLGWFGGGIYLLAISVLVCRIVTYSTCTSPALRSYQAVVCGLIPMALFGSVFLSVSGALLWTVLSLASAHDLQSKASAAL